MWELVRKKWEKEFRVRGREKRAIKVRAMAGKMRGQFTYRFYVSINFGLIGILRTGFMRKSARFRTVADSPMFGFIRRWTGTYPTNLFTGTVGAIFWHSNPLKNLITPFKLIPVRPFKIWLHHSKDDFSNQLIGFSIGDWSSQFGFRILSKELPFNSLASQKCSQKYFSGSQNIILTNCSSFKLISDLLNLISDPHKTNSSQKRRYIQTDYKILSNDDQCIQNIILTKER